MSRLQLVASITTCIVMVLVAAAPIAAGAHLITKGEQGPNASAVTWEYVPATYGTWTGHIVNNGLKSLTVDVYDNTTGVPQEIMHQRIRFAAYNAFPTGEVDTMRVIVSPIHRYSITVIPNGPKGSSCTVDDMFPPPPPCAVITIVSVEYLTVVVDGSLSHDPDGTIVSYVWDFGDGSSAIGMTATHTYAMAGTYEITLTVTDNNGVTSSVSDPVSVYWPPPVASFTYTVDGFSVSVNASGSTAGYGITTYLWDWGDQTTSYGITATHSYVGREGGPPDPPYVVFGFVYGRDGVVVDGGFVKVENTRTGEFALVTTANGGYYEFNLNRLPSSFMDGDVVNVTVWGNNLVGYSEAIADLYLGYLWMDVTLSDYPVPPLEVFVTLGVYDTIGQYDYVTQRIVFPTPLPPLVVFGYTYNVMAQPLSGSIVNVSDLRTGGSLSLTTDANGFFQGDLNVIPGGWQVGDVIRAWATWGRLGEIRDLLLTVENTVGGSIRMDVVLRGGPPPPLSLFGYTYGPDGLPLYGCAVTATDLRTGEHLLTTSDAVYGMYIIDDLTMLPGGWMLGDTIRVTATMGTLSGSADVVIVDPTLPNLWVDVTLH